MDQILSWILTILAILTIWLTGEKWKYAHVVALIGNIVWFIYAYYTKQYAFFVCTLLKTVINIRNLYKWTHEEAD